MTIPLLVTEAPKQQQDNSSFGMTVGRDKMLAVAHKLATPEQRAAMKAVGIQTKLGR